MRYLMLSAVLLTGCSSGTTTSSNTPENNTPACLAVGANCTSTPNACCSGICEMPVMAGEPSLCATPCTSGAECNSGCCAPLANDPTLSTCEGRGFCSSTCVAPGGSCTSSLDCCANETCSTAGGGTCAALCATGADCASGCCAPLSNASVSVCSAVQFCQ